MKHVARSPVAKCVYGGFEGRLTYTFVQPPGNPITSLRTRSNLHHLNHHNLAQQPTNPLHSNFYFITFTCSYHHIYRGPVPFSGILSLVGSSSPLQLLLPWVSTSVTPTISPTPPTKPAGNPSPLLSDLRRHRGSRPAALVCTAVERVASKFFYHKYRLVGTAKKVINTAIAVLETVEVVCAHHLQQTDSAPPAESLTSAILGTRPSGSAKVTLPPHAVSFVVGAFYRLSTIFGGDFHVKLANFLSRVSPRGFLLLKTALEDVYEWLIETTKQHIRFGRERYPILPRTTFYLLTVSIAVLVFLLAVISAFPADGVVRHNYISGTGRCPGKGSRFVIIC